MLVRGRLSGAAAAATSFGRADESRFSVRDGCAGGRDRVGRRGGFGFGWSTRRLLVVDTQFRTAPSDIVEAGGAFADCTQVTDLVVGGEQIGPNKVLFFGDKLVQCAEGTVTIHYNATFNFAAGKKTSGHWFVVDSTLPGVTSGFGTVRGDNSACEVADYSDGCILDTFAGTVE